MKRLYNLAGKSAALTVTAFLVALHPALYLTPSAQAKTGGYYLSYGTIHAGASTSSGARFILSGAIGWPDAGLMTGANFELIGGFWPGGQACIVEFHDFAKFAELWLETGSELGPDLDQDGDVDYLDLKSFTDDWLFFCPRDWPLRQER